MSSVKLVQDIAEQMLHSLLAYDGELDECEVHWLIAEAFSYEEFDGPLGFYEMARKAMEVLLKNKVVCRYQFSPTIRVNRGLN